MTEWSRSHIVLGLGFTKIWEFISWMINPQVVIDDIHYVTCVHTDVYVWILIRSANKEKRKQNTRGIPYILDFNRLILILKIVRYSTQGRF